jgi:hypothetical protein
VPAAFPLSLLTAVTQHSVPQVYASIVTNLGLFAFSSRQMAQWAPQIFGAPAAILATPTDHGGGGSALSGQRYTALVLVVVVEHVLVALAALAEASVPPLPMSVRHEVARMAHEKQAIAKKEKAHRKLQAGKPKK